MAAQRCLLYDVHQEPDEGLSQKDRIGPLERLALKPFDQGRSQLLVSENPLVVQ